MKDEKKEIKKYQGGYCDGLGCGYIQPCFCVQYEMMVNSFQERNHMEWDINNPFCQEHDRKWREENKR